ncbi:J domain-containing protein [Rosenbergiella epipactidis]|uniref:J domain-containing protein n=1 Tax=Rosenbergiella epipactidis TaxID=1544694 RepID=UPI001F4DD533|nr:J domain-containing protein [Rosenbergiella epipactidis]
MATIWHVLGIEPTKDEREIRRAYAKELKRRRPDNDPQGYQELREAYEQAKNYANVEVILRDQKAISSEPTDSTPMVEYVRQLMLAKDLKSEENWDRAALDKHAQEIATLLIKDEHKGLHELHHYLDHQISDSLEVRQTFRLVLGEELSRQQGLYRHILDKVSEVLDWQINSYHSSQLPAYLLSALEEQVAKTEQENYWQSLTQQYSGSRLGQLKWRLLTEKNTSIPWWCRLIPDFLSQLIKQVSEISQQFPTLQGRLNPLLLVEYYKPGLGLSWGAVIATLFWGYTASLLGQESTKMAIQSGIMSVVVAAFIWGYPLLIHRFAAGKIMNKCVHTFFWLASVAIIAIAFYSAWAGASAWQKDTISIRIVIILLFLILPVVGMLYQNRSDWRMLPTKMISIILIFPVLFIRGLPPLINLLGLIFLPILYSVFIKMIFFVQ